VRSTGCDPWGHVVPAGQQIFRTTRVGWRTGIVRHTGGPGGCSSERKDMGLGRVGKIYTKRALLRIFPSFHVEPWKIIDRYCCFKNSIRRKYWLARCFQAIEKSSLVLCFFYTQVCDPRGHVVPRSGRAGWQNLEQHALTGGRVLFATRVGRASAAVTKRHGARAGGWKWESQGGAWK
jgi:hypothetical protein